MKKIFLLTLATGALTINTAQAETNPALEGVYVGGGVSYNDLDFGSVLDNAPSKSAFGFQVFAGKYLDNSIDGFDTAIEIGISQTDEFDWGPGAKEEVTGLMASGVITRDLDEVADKLYGLARLGIDIGDDDGLFMGVGAGYKLNEKVDIRAEYLNKDLITAYQVNAIYRF